MTTADAVRRRFGLGRLLALGGAADGVWLTEAAALEVLRRAAGLVPGVVTDRVRLEPLGPDPASAADPAAPAEAAPLPATAPPGALPPGPLRITAECAATDWAVPLPEAAARLREALLTAAEESLDLLAPEADIRVTALREAAPDTPGAPGTPAGAVPETSGTDGTTDGPTAGAVRKLPGVGAPVTVRETAAGVLRVEIVVRRGHHPLEVARAARATAARADTADRPVIVVITGVAV
ncbi:nucleopolyhedrovirus P10 family protein [Streptomyces sp. NPDC000594]|uniref:nucleopolyhedrovirus P10 family protein n=1 Tax=Streptomyces sp. NPDC000594 TaxID=3154261 RepID=UPI00332D3241